MSELVVKATADGIMLEVRVAPRSSREAIVGVHAGALKVALSAPPVDGKANEALIELLARSLGVPKRAVTLVRGHTSRNKTVCIAGVGADQVNALGGQGR